MSPFCNLDSRRRVLAAATVVAALAAAPATRADDAPALFTLAPIVVTPTRLPTPETDVASSITVITAEDIARKQERTLPDVLADVPGLNVVQVGGPGGGTSVFMRGTDPNQVKVLIDGIDASDPSSSGGTFNFEHVLTSDIARVEVLRGPQSGLYGAGAIGGVINIITKQGEGPPAAEASIEGGAFATLNETAGVRGAASRLSYAVDVAHFHSGDTAATPFDLVPPGRSVTGNSYDNKTASTRLGLTLTDNLDVGLVARIIDTGYSFTSDDALGPEPLKSDADKQQLLTRGTAHLVLFDGGLDQTLGFAFSGFHERDVDPNATAFAPGPNNFRGDRFKLDWQGNVALAAGETLTLGAEHQLDTVASDEGPVDAQVQNDAGFVQLQSSVAGRFFNTVSLRYDDNGQFGSKATWRVAPALLFPDAGTKLKATVGTGFNPPSLIDLYQSFPAFGFFANPDLRPETSIGYDLGFEQAVLDRRVQFGATYFHNDIANLITINDAGTTLVNIGQATTYGVESYVQWRPIDPLKFRLDDTYTMAQDDILHVELIRRPRQKISLDGSWQITETAQLSATVIRLGPFVDINRAGTASGVTVNGFTLVNLAWSYEFGRGVTGFARIDNLLDRHYQDPLGFERPGIGVFAGVRVAFDKLTGGS